MSDERPDAWSKLEEHYALSPIHTALGLSLRIVEHGHADIHYDGRAEAANRRGNASGGAIAQMVDSAVMQSVATTVSEGDFFTTLELKVNYVRAAAPSATLVAHGVIEHVGRTTAVGSVRVVDSDDRLIALGMVTIAVRRAGE